MLAPYQIQAQLDAGHLSEAQAERALAQFRAHEIAAAKSEPVVVAVPTRGYSRAKFDLDMAEIARYRAALARLVVERELDGLAAVRSYRACAVLEQAARRKLASIARAIEDRALDDWREGHVTEFPRR